MAYGGYSDDDFYYDDDHTDGRWWDYNDRGVYDDDDYEDEDEDEDGDYYYDDDYDESEDSDSEEYQEESSSQIKEIICEVLRENGVNPNNVKYQYRRDAKGFAWFNCPRGHNNWPSAHAWCVIDLYNQSVTSPYEQDCKKCNSSAYPKFKQDVIRKMVSYVVNCYLVKIGKRQYVSSTDTEKPGNQRGPHDEERCGKCRRLGKSCWK